MSIAYGDGKPCSLGEAEEKPDARLLLRGSLMARNSGPNMSAGGPGRESAQLWRLVAITWRRRRGAPENSAQPITGSTRGTASSASVTNAINA
ncbi:hypothetical protein GCM10019059_37320 [Camelimonas fluminis]|nr:hypothetical protein GCM10019059_37320 [Camelimonas fluminis]